VIAVGDASTAPLHSSSITPRSTTCILCHMAAPTSPATSFSPAPAAIVSKATCCRPNSSPAIRGRAWISSPTLEPFIERWNGVPAGLWVWRVRGRR